MPDSIFRRACRDWWHSLTNSGWMWIWTAALGLVGVGVGAYYGYGHHSRQGTVAITVGTAAAFLVAALAIALVWRWIALAPRSLLRETRGEVVRLTTAQSELPKLTVRFLPPEGPHFWLEVTNEGPNNIPDEWILLNMLVPKTWNLKSGGGNFSPSRENLRMLDGTEIPAWLWSFKDNDPPVVGLSQTYEFMFNEAPEPAIYPLSVRIRPYVEANGVMAF